MSQPITLEISGHAETNQTQTYTNLPFDVPEGIGRIDVSYEYSDQVGSDPHLTNGNTVDIGIFDPRGAGFNEGGFRGWSGSARSSFFVAREDSTPGYLRGAVQAGTWNICLGLYKIAAQGCDFRVAITLTPDVGARHALPLQHAISDDMPPMLTLRSTSGKVKADGWYCGEMHCHTYHSDGDSSPLEVVRKAEALGLDFLAIMDHNDISHLVAMNSIETPLILIPGLEVTTYKGHWNVWGDQGWIDFRIENEAQMAAAVAEAKRRGYVTSLNHPRPYGPDWVYTAADDHHCIEVWNGGWALFNNISLEFWESRLRQGRRYTAVGGSDSHFHKREHHAQFANPTLWIFCEGEPSALKLLDAIRAGHVAISESPSGARLTLNAGDAMMGDSLPRPTNGRLTVSVTVRGGSGNQLELHTAQGCVHSEPVSRDEYAREIEVDVTDTPYVRAQLMDDREQARLVRALTNPIYVE